VSRRTTPVPSSAWPWALLATVSLSLPLLVGGALALTLGATLAFVMPERNFHPAPNEGAVREGAVREGRARFARVAETARGGVRLARGRPVLLTLLAAILFFGVSGEGFDRLWERTS
jgi:hypothetical protein